MDRDTLKEILKTLMEKMEVCRYNYNISPTPYREGLVYGWNSAIQQVEIALEEIDRGI